MVTQGGIRFLGKHLILELREAEEGKLDDTEFIRQTLHKAAKAAGVTVIRTQICKFEPQGVSGIVFIAESHISVHTWPEFKLAAVDIFTCGKTNPRKAAEVFMKEIGGVPSVFEIKRLRVPKGAKVNDSKKISVVL